MLHDLLKSSDSQYSDLQQAIQHDADSCVMCGMCVPHCPTYQVYRNESESPRGRISIIQAYAQGRINPDARMLQHLDHCLGCLACEAMCPSKVAYGRLLDNAQAMLANNRSQPPLLRFLLTRTQHAGGLNRYANPLRWYKLSGLQKLNSGLLRLGGNTHLARAHNVLSLIQGIQLNNFYPATNKASGDVALFTGCMGTAFDAETLLSTIKLITHCGYNLHIPADQFCCGALHQHHGQPEQARQLTQQNQEIFGKLPISHIIHTANGCGAQLNQNKMPAPVIDIVSFLLSLPNLVTTRFQPLRESVFIHESCSSTNKLKLTGAMQQLLRSIPQLQIIETQTTSVCCGAGSSHQLLFPELADELLQQKIRQIKRTQPKYLLSDNLGCSLHFKNSLNKADIEIEVIHPVTLLARQLS